VIIWLKAFDGKEGGRLDIIPLRRKSLGYYGQFYYLSQKDGLTKGRQMAGGRCAPRTFGGAEGKTSLKVSHFPFSLFPSSFILSLMFD
jgi:hypothetical protein